MPYNPENLYDYLLNLHKGDDLKAREAFNRLIEADKEKYPEYYKTEKEVVNS